MSDITFRLTGGTNVGLVRTNNEDNFIVNADLTQQDWFIPKDTAQDITLGEAGCLFVVADGMGGMNAGEVASAIAIDSVKEAFSIDDFTKVTKSPNRIIDFLQKTIEQADLKIKNRVKEDPATSGMGTTIVIGWVLDDVVHISWCGDSRAYVFNPNFGMARLSKDHSYVQQLVDEGKLDAELAFDHPNSNIITRSLGDTNSKACPDYVMHKLSEGDMIILCSDGLCGLCRDEEILEVLQRQTDDIEQCKNDLIAAALEAGGYDNVTVALFKATQVKRQETDAIDLTQNDFKAKPKKKIAVRVLVALLIVLLLVTIAYVAYVYKTEGDLTSLQLAVQKLVAQIVEKIQELSANIKK